MSPSRSARQRFRRALALSIGLHICAALLVVFGAALPLGSGTTRDGGRAFETMRVSYLRLEHRVRARPQPQRDAVRHAGARTVAARTEPRATAVRASGARLAAARVPAERAIVAPSLRRARAAADVFADRESAARAATRRLPALGASPVAPPPRRLAAHAALPGATTVTTPTESPPVAASASPGPANAGTSEQVAARGIDVPPGGWGQSFERPLIADEAALETLRSRYHASAAVRVEVDDAGRAIHVILPATLPEDVRAELERRLLALRYVPAECNGLRCTGTLQITI